MASENFLKCLKQGEHAETVIGAWLRYNLPSDQWRVKNTSHVHRIYPDGVKIQGVRHHWEINQKSYKYPDYRVRSNVTGHSYLIDAKTRQPWDDCFKLDTPNLMDYQFISSWLQMPVFVMFYNEIYDVDHIYRLDVSQPPTRSYLYNNAYGAGTTYFWHVDSLKKLAINF